MTVLSVLLTFLTAALIVSTSLKIRQWVKAMRKDLDAIRAELKDIRIAHSDVGREIREYVTQAAEESVNASCLQALRFDFPVFLGGPSIDAQHARLLLFILQERKPRTILELGSGSSTVIIAHAMKRLEAPMPVHIAVDHEERFLENTRELARVNGVVDRVRFEHCPLGPLDGFALPWYSGVPEVVRGEQLDLVIIDGPPAYAVGEGRAREPALTVLRPFLSKGAVVILDDANRPGEKESLEEWKLRFPEFTVQVFAGGKGVAVLTLRNPI